MKTILCVLFLSCAAFAAPGDPTNDYDPSAADYGGGSDRSGDWIISLIALGLTGWYVVVQTSQKH